MKKKILTMVTFGLFVFAIFFSFSQDSNGKVAFIKAAKAEVSGFGYQSYYYWCPDWSKLITVCGRGNSNCTPYGICP